MKLIAQMVLRNEENRHLDEVLDHLEKRVDLIVVTDDASTDNTAKIAESHGAKVKVMDSPMFTTHEGQLRMAAWEHLRKYAGNGDWIMVVDGDEKPYFNKPWDMFLDGLRNVRWDVLGVEFYHMWSSTHYRVDKLWKPTTSHRCFRFYDQGMYRDRVLACGAEPMYVERIVRNRTKFLSSSGLVMQHLGYARDEDKQAKYDRYMTLDQGRYHNINHLKSILDPDPMLLPWNQVRAF